MMKKAGIIVAMLAFVLALGSCAESKLQKVDENKKVWAWLAGKVAMTPEQWEHYFSKASAAGIDAIILEVHGGYPEIQGDTTDFTDKGAIQIIQTALPYAKKHNIELHAWMWTTNRTEMNLRQAHPDWYQRNAEDSSCLDVKLYNREHYRWLCPTRPETAEYLKARVAELASIDGLAGVHLDFIRYPDAILPYGLHASRGVVQDKVYPHWDHCYCPACREAFQAQTGIDPMTLEDPTANAEWMQFRWDAVARLASELGKEIQAHGKMATAAVFASPEESKKLVRQDWANFKNMDVLFPMIYHKFYDKPDQWIETATREGVEALKASGNPARLCSGLFVGHVPAEKMDELFGYATKGGSTGICIFSLEGVDKTEGYWDALGAYVKRFKAQK